MSGGSYFRPSANPDRRISATRILGICLPILFFLTAGSTGLAQEQQQEQKPMPEMGQADQQMMSMEGESTRMQDMARAMESMADMCRMMMQREMQQRPYLMAAGAVVGALLAIALILFIVLEIQWIRFFGVKIKTERQKLTSSMSGIVSK